MTVSNLLFGAVSMLPFSCYTASLFYYFSILLYQSYFLMLPGTTSANELSLAPFCLSLQFTVFDEFVEILEITEVISFVKHLKST